MTMSAICIVNGMSDQKPPPKSCVSCAGPRPSSRPATNTTTIPTRAKTNASGNQRSVQSEIAIPTRIAAGSRERVTADVSTMGASPSGHFFRNELPDPIHRGGVLERRQISEIGLAEVRAANHPAQDFGVPRLRELGHEPDGVGSQRPAQQLHDLVRDVARQGVRWLAAGAQYGEHDHRLAFELVRDADHRGLEHGRVRCGRRLDLRGTDPFPRHLQRVVAAAVDVPESIIVDPRPVAVDPDGREASPVRRQVVLGGVPEAPRHTWPRLPDDELAHRAADRSAAFVTHVRSDAGHGARKGGRLERHPRRTADYAARYLCPTGVIHERRTPLAHYTEVPPPRLGIPGLARGPEHE